MKGLRGDLVLLALVVSAAAHFGVMFSARPMVMVTVAGQGSLAHRRGPMRVTEPLRQPDPVRMDVVEDVEAAKDAPAAEETVTSVPSVDTALPSPEPAASDAPSVPAPEFEVPVAMESPPPVMTSEAAPAAPRSSPRDTMPEAVLPPAASAAPSAPGPSDAAGLPFVPVFNAPSVAAMTPPESGAAAEEKMGVGGAGDGKPEFKPAVEVMEKVNENVVEQAKEAVKALVDVQDAAELAGHVSVALSRAHAAPYTYFRVKISPNADLATVPKDLVVLLDASGSIGRDRMASIRQAARKLLRSAANTGDRFNLVAFRDRFTYAFKTWQECTESSFAAAEGWLGEVAAYGRTDVFATIASVLTLPRDPSRPLVALVVTDGDANVGVKETAQIISRFSALNDGLVSVYMYGVKESANKELIDVLTRGNRGDSFIFDGWKWKAGSGMEGLAERFRDPVLSDLRVVFAAGCRAEAYPRLLKNLYRGESVEIVGRVPDGVREVSFSLKGLNGRTAYESFFRLPLDSAPEDPSVASAWREEMEIDRKLR